MWGGMNESVVRDMIQRKLDRWIRSAEAGSGDVAQWHSTYFVCFDVLVSICDIIKRP